MNDRQREIVPIIDNVNNNEENEVYQRNFCWSILVGPAFSFIGGAAYTLASYSAGNAILQENSWEYGSVGVAILTGGVATAIPGTVASLAFLVDYPNEQGSSSRPGLLPFARKHLPAITFALSLASEAITQGFYHIPSFLGANNADGTSHDFYPDKPLFDKTSMVNPTLLGNAIITGGVLTAYGAYKLIKKRFARHEQVNVPVEPVQEEEVEEMIPYQPLNDFSHQSDEAKPSSKPYNQKIEEILKDPVHLDPMKEPIVLNCGHTIDNTTLLDIKESKSCKCPTCRQTILENVFKKPTKNYSLIAVFDAWNEEQKKLAKQNNEVKSSNEDSVVIQIHNDAADHVPEIAVNNVVEEKDVANAAEINEQKDVANTIEINEEKDDLTNQEKLINFSIPLSSINHRFICPLTKKIMNEPVRASDNGVYEKAALIEYIFNKQNLQHPIISPILLAENVRPMKGKWFNPAKDIEVMIDRFFKHKNKSSLVNNGLFNRIFNRTSSKPNNNNAAALRI